MSEEVKNEIVLDRLFRPTRKVKVRDTELVVRALSGPEQEARLFYATGQTRKLEKQLADHDSEAYQVRLKFLEDKNADELALFLTSFAETGFRRDALKENPQPTYQPIPDEATEEERRETLDAREKAITEWQAKIDAVVKDRLDAYTEKNIKDKSAEQLLKLAKDQIAEPYLNERFNMAYLHYSLYLSVQKLDGSRYFESSEDAGALERNTVFYLYNEFKEVNEIDPLASVSNGASSTA